MNLGICIGVGIVWQRKKREVECFYKGMFFLLWKDAQ